MPSNRCGTARGGRTTAISLGIAGLLVLSTGCSAGTDDHGAAATRTSAPPPSTTTAPTTVASSDPTAGPTTQPTATSTTTSTTTGTTAAERAALDGRTVVVDPGHNGANGAHPSEIGRLVDAGGFQKPCNTTGAAEGDVQESTLNLLLAEALRDELLGAGAEVVMTRTTDDGWGPCVDERGGTAARHGADVLISLHADGAAATAHGFHVIHQAPVAGFVDDRLAARSTDLATAVRDHLVAAGLTPSTYIGGGTGLHRRDDLGTLNRSAAPAVMIETGNLHHPADLDAMRDPAWRTTVARAVVAALVDDLGPAPAGPR